MARLPLLLVASASSIALLLLLCVSLPSGADALDLSTLELGSSFRRVEGAESLHEESPPEPTLPVNSPCAARCTSDTTCTASCDSKCRNGDFDCQIECRGRCLTAVTSCVEQCARDFAAAQASDNMEKLEEEASPKSKGPAPRHFSLNTGYGPEKAHNWAGYVSINGSTPTTQRHLWYWAFESRNDPTNDPLVLWMTGGPGCSGLVALFYENGPYIIKDDLSLAINPHSWNSNATVIWIDQPSGTGFSFADSGDFGPFSEDEIADDMYMFLQGFFRQYPQYSKLPFHITGESYAGHYIPSVATRILQGNSDPTWPKINLHSLAIGNGLVDPKIQYAQYLPYASAMGVLPNSSLEFMEQGLPACMAAIDQCAHNTTEGIINCVTATATCNLFELIPFQLSGLNVYDVREKCQVPPLCYDFSNLDAFLAQADVAEALGVTGRMWVSCNRLVTLQLVFAGDWMRNLALQVPAILASGVRIVVYSGEYDFICNWYGSLAWTDSLSWPGQQQFVNARNTTWLYRGEEAGTSRTAQGLTFTRVKDAGHMVPLDQPARSLDMLARIINGAPFNAEPPHAHLAKEAQPAAPTHKSVINPPRVALE